MASINNSLNLHFTFYLRALATHKQGMHVQYPEDAKPYQDKIKPNGHETKTESFFFSTSFSPVSDSLQHAGSGSTHPDFKIRDSSQPGRTM